MERTVEYQMPKDEFDGLLEHLRENGKYQAHGYRGMPDSTIDDGSSTRFEDCQRFSTFQFAGGKSVTLRVRDSGLAQTIDSYFTSQQ